jgi:hypothetical protein
MFYKWSGAAFDGDLSNPANYLDDAGLPVSEPPTLGSLLYLYTAYLASGGVWPISGTCNAGLVWCEGEIDGGAWPYAVVHVCDESYISQGNVRGGAFLNKISFDFDEHWGYGPNSAEWAGQYSDGEEAQSAADKATVSGNKSKVQSGQVVLPGADAGTYDPITGNYTDPGEAHVEDGVTYKFAGANKEGSFAPPAGAPYRRLPRLIGV